MSKNSNHNGDKLGWLVDQKLTAEDYAEVARQGKRREWFTKFFALVANRQREQEKATADSEADEDAA